ncbi:hypothetical protein [Micromonospora sp. NBC_01813]|uniref:hypothetical protein n=1 Tax=Micromonospora sp. NBC_01813 TaxID=2975988 RepID=UPI002DDA9FE0|nr:hypothetical protein [Micromonospora sp. NBC_01813]WSA06803.1 hypothetical protein OG958_21280 [Micromonospora sp. NBC_01813]
MTRKPRRALLAELLLLADPVAVRDRGDGSLAVDFDSFAALRAWLAAAGLDGPDVMGHEYTYTNQADGQPYRSLTAWPTWHGWEITARAVEPSADLAPLDTDTADALTALAVA